VYGPNKTVLTDGTSAKGTMPLRPSWGLHGNPAGPNEGERQQHREERKRQKAAAKTARKERAVQKAAEMSANTGTRAEDDLNTGGADATHCARRGELLHGRGKQSVTFGESVVQQSEQETARQLVGRKEREGQEIAAPQVEGGNVADQELTVGQSAAVARSDVDYFVSLLMGGTRRSRARVVQDKVIQGFEVQWRDAVKAALKDLEAEFNIADMHAQYDVLCVFGKELLLRELQGKAVRILAHKKRKIKERGSVRTKQASR
jgi:hypothetical protein